MVRDFFLRSIPIVITVYLHVFVFPSFSYVWGTGYIKSNVLGYIILVFVQLSFLGLFLYPIRVIYDINIYLNEMSSH